MPSRDGPPLNGAEYCGNGLPSQMEARVPAQNPDGSGCWVYPDPLVGERALSLVSLQVDAYDTAEE